MNDRLKKFLAYFDSVGKIAVALGAVVALIAGIVALVYQLLPNPTPPSPARSAKLAIKDSFPAKYRVWLLSTGETITGYSKAQLEQRGTEYYLTVTVEGLRDANPTIVWNLQDINRIPTKQQQYWIRQFLARFTPPTETYEGIVKVWIQEPPFLGKFYAEVEIEYPDFETLGVVRTPTFTVREMQPLEPAGLATRTRTTTSVTALPPRTTSTVTTTSAVTTAEVPTTATTTLYGTTTTSTGPVTTATTATIATTATATITTTSTVTVPITVPATTSTVTATTTETFASTTPAHVPVVRPPAKVTPR